jgi:hypothetical protein
MPADMASAAESEETTAQLINIGLIIIAWPTAFANDVRNWHDLPSADKTWNGFKTHFKDAQRAIIRSLPAVATDSLGCHEQANAASVATVVDQVIDQLQAQQNAVSALTPDSAAEVLAEQQMNLQLANMANATQQSQTMFKQMQSSNLPSLLSKTKSTTTATTLVEEVEEEEETDDQGVEAEVETEVEAEAQAEEADEAADKMAQQELADPQHTAGRTATAHIPAPIATTKLKAMSTPPPTPTCKAAASAVAVGSEIWGH